MVDIRLSHRRPFVAPSTTIIPVCTACIPVVMRGGSAAKTDRALPSAGA